MNLWYDGDRPRTEQDLLQTITQTPVYRFGLDPDVFGFLKSEGKSLMKQYEEIYEYKLPVGTSCKIPLICGPSVEYRELSQSGHSSSSRRVHVSIVRQYGRIGPETLFIESRYYPYRHKILIYEGPLRQFSVLGDSLRYMEVDRVRRPLGPLERIEYKDVPPRWILVGSDDQTVRLTDTVGRYLP